MEHSRKRRLSLKRRYQIWKQELKIRRNERRHRRAKLKKMHHVQRKEWNHRMYKKFTSFISDPFGRKHVDRDRKMILKQVRRERREMFLKWLSAFLHNPLILFKMGGRPGRDEQVIRQRFRYERRQNRKKWFSQLKKDPLHTLFPKHKEDRDAKTIKKLIKRDRKLSFRKKAKTTFATFREILSTVDLRNKFILNFLQSTGYFLLSFLLMYAIYQLSTIIIAKSFNIPTVWYYNILKFPLYTYSPLYTRIAMIIIFGSGPLISFLLAVAFLRLFFLENSHTAPYRLFFLWCAINGINLFFGSYLVGFITRTEFIYSSEWLFMSYMYDVEEILFVLIAFFVMIFLGKYATKLFMFSSGSATLIMPKYRLFFILTQVFIPWLVGVGIIYLITFPKHYLPLTMKTITPLLLIIPMLFNYHSIEKDEVMSLGGIRRISFKWSIIIFVIVLLFIYRAGLNSGIKI